MILSGWILCIAGFLAGGLIIMGISGKYNLRGHAVSCAAETDKAVRTGSTAVIDTTDNDIAGQALMPAPGSVNDGSWKEGRIRYQGKAYDYNSDIITFLFMGIDQNKEEMTSGKAADGGQADALFLLVLNFREETMQVISINRNTMTAVDVYDEEGVCKRTVLAQICTQHGFGDGGVRSCEYQVKAVSRLCYGIPIHGYLAVDMSVIEELTELAGGIDLKALEDIHNGQGQVILRQGEQVHLNGEQAYWYVRDRDSKVPLSADARLERQRQFLAEYIDKVKRQTRQDMRIPLQIFHKIADRAVTDITADEVVYLAATAGGYRFDAGKMIAIPGESISGEENTASDYDEFYADEEALYEMILEVFYEAVE